MKLKYWTIFYTVFFVILATYGWQCNKVLLVLISIINIGIMSFGTVIFIKKANNIKEYKIFFYTLLIDISIVLLILSLLVFLLFIFGKFLDSCMQKITKFIAINLTGAGLSYLSKVPMVIPGAATYGDLMYSASQIDNFAKGIILGE